MARDPLEIWHRFHNEATRKATDPILQRFEVYCRKTPEELVRTAKTGSGRKWIEKSLERFLRSRETEDGLGPGGSVSKEGHHIKSFFGANGIIDVTLSKRYRKIRSDYKVPFRGPLTKEKVQAMIEQEPVSYKKAVIMTFAQTGQRLGVLPALDWKDDRKAKITKRDGWGLVHIYRNTKNGYGKTFEAPYSFMIHPQTMKLLSQIQRNGDSKVFHIPLRQMQKIVTDAAKKAGIQEPVRTRFEGRVRRQITADSFVAYWRDRMRAAGISDKVLLDYLIGYRISARDQFSDEQLAETYKKAKACLNIPIRAE